MDQINNRLLKNRIKKILIKFVLLFFVIVPFSTIALLQTSVFQTFLSERILKSYIGETGGDISFDSFYFSPFSGVDIKNLYIEDDKNDTLFFAENLSVGLKSFDFKKSKFEINNLKIKNAYYNIYSINDSNQTNMQYIINYFASTDYDEIDSTKNDFILNVDLIDISNLRFKYKQFFIDTVDYGINFSDINMNQFDFKAENFRMVNDSMNVDIRNILIDEASGFKLNSLSGYAVISSTEISVNNLIFKTPQSNVFASRYAMNYREWGAMSDFLNKVKLELDLQLSSINIQDIAYFSSFFKHINLPTYARGRVYGTISNLKSKRFLVSLGENSRVETSFSMQGLPDIEETFLSLDIKKINLDMNDLETLMSIQSEDVRRDVPVLLKRIGDLSYQGNITGFLTDLVAYGTFRSKDGLLNTDVRYKYNTENKSVLYSGKVNTKSLDLSALNLTDTMFGNITMNGNVLVKVDSLNELEGQLDGDILSLGINNYQYKNIKVHANLDKLTLKSLITLNDTNIYLKLNSSIDFSLDEPYFDFTAKLKDANLVKLNWLNRDTSSLLSFNVDAEFSSLNLDKFFGEFIVDSLLYSEKGNHIFANEINLRSVKIEKKRQLEVNSDLFNVKFVGDFSIKELIPHLDKVLNSYLPSLVSYDKKNLHEQNINYTIDLKNTYSVFRIFSPNFLLANHTLIKGGYDSRNDSITLLVNSDSCVFDTYFVDKINLKINGNRNSLISKLGVDYLKLTDELFFNGVNLNNELHSDSLSTYLSWENKKREMESAELMSQIIFNPSTLDSLSFDINMIPSYLYIEDSIWYINDSKIQKRGAQLTVENLIVNHENQYIYANGSWQKDKKDSLHVIINQLDLSYFPIIEQKTTLNMQGLVDGDVLLSYKGQQALFSGYVSTDSLRINDKLLGNTFVNLEWNNRKKWLLVNVKNEIGKKHLKSIVSNGYLDFENLKMNLDVRLKHQRLGFFEPFANEYITGLSGDVSGEINISGPFSDLGYRGELSFSRATLLYKYLGVKYNFSNKIKITKNTFEVNNLKIYQVDHSGNYALVNGYVQHNNFSDFQFFLDLDLKNLMVLNTSQKDNDLYYGTAFVSGPTRITGTQENLKIDISGTTQRGTKFYIPLSDAEEVEGNDFISFKTANIHENKSKKTDYKIDLSGILLNFNLTVTPDAEVQLIFDDKVGDVLKARGDGNLNLKINTLGNFSMSGNYSITKGDYLFTLQNVVNKKFKIEPGSDIKWNGDPYQAYLDIDAIYRLKTPIYDLTLNPDDKERIPVECHLNMKKSLLAPDITFDIKLPSSGDRAKSLISTMDQDEKNKQLLSLLVLSKFYTPDYLVGGEEVSSGNSVGKNASELLSNQLSNWLSQVNDNFDIGVNYRPGDNISNDELEVALSTQLFNDRVNIDGNVGVSDYANTNSNVVGNVNVDVKINKKGTVRIRGFNRVNENEIENNSLYTQGVGLYYREDFDTWGELLNKYWKKATFQNTPAKQDSLK